MPLHKNKAPHLPPGLRLAQPIDLPRIALVAAAGYFEAPEFPHTRPHFSSYPTDTIANFYNHHLQYLQDPKCVVVVAEDIAVEDEEQAISEHLRGIVTKLKNCKDPQRKTVVGVSYFSWPNGSPWKGWGKDQVMQSANFRFMIDQRRDTSVEFLRIRGYALNAVGKGSHVGHIWGEAMLVHPAYKGKNYDSEWMKWVFDFAAEAELKVAFFALPKEKGRYTELGARETRAVQIPRFEGPLFYTLFTRDWKEIKIEGRAKGT